MQLRGQDVNLNEIGLKFMKEIQLPNGDTIFFIDKFTAEYVYNEIYLDNVYLQHGISIEDNDIIFDIGANMGIA